MNGNITLAKGWILLCVIRYNKFNMNFLEFLQHTHIQIILEF